MSLDANQVQAVDLSRATAAYIAARDDRVMLLEDDSAAISDEDEKAVLYNLLSETLMSCD